MFNTVIGGVMPWKTHVLYFLLTATLSSIKLNDGRTADVGTVLQRPAETMSALSPRFGTVQGSLHFRSVKHESAAPTRGGSLALRLDNQKPTTALHSLMDAKLKRMDPSVQCGDNLMTLKVKQTRAPRFLVDSGEGPIPLSQMPSSCGYFVKRSRRDVLFAAPYQGCHVTQQGGNYVLPLRLSGAPMTMSCPIVSPLPSISCFPTGMVLKIVGVTASELKVKVSGTWKSLSSVCSSCGFAVEELSGGLTLTAPYPGGSCIEMKDEEYLLSLLLADVELLVTCPSLPSVKPTTATTTPSSDGGQFPQYPLYPQFPIFPQHPVFPGPSPQTQSPTAPTDAPAPQLPQLPSSAGADSGPDTENQEVPAAQQPAFPFMPQYSQFPQFPLFPRPVPPIQSTADKNTAAPPAQLPQIMQSPQYLYPFPPQFPMVPGIFHSTTTPPPATSAEVLVTTPAPTEHDGKPNFPQQPQFPVLSPYPFLPFPNRPVSPGDQPQAVQDPKPVPQQPKPYVYPQTYQIPMFYPPQKQSTQSQTAAPATTSTTTATTTLKPSIQKPFYYQHPYMPLYYAPPQQPVFPDTPTTPPPPPATSAEILVTTPAPTEHDGKPNFPQQPQFPVLSPYPFLPFPNRPVPPGDPPQAVQDPKPVLQQPKPHVYPQTYQIPMFYPPQKQSTQSQTAAPATTSTTTATTTLKPSIQKPFYYQHPYMPLYYAPQQPVFPDHPTTPPTPASADQNQHHTMSPSLSFRNW
ncbi:leucine-rich repeat extensin-like protein 5 [Thunnus maccoyii]|uniref:leucine-rich repeat extensin-like protein 5 n=1 Tax=Thunnus maccoyii TaxID=8240 RepID=UPI001C4CA5FE|nr:leucine-rich repeat extensin-like protein 5 [Thunnus maccoyii]